MDDEEHGIEVDEVTYWPSNSNTEKNYFGRRWCATEHSILEYRFRADANVEVTPVWDEPRGGPEW